MRGAGECFGAAGALAFATELIARSKVVMITTRILRVFISLKFLSVKQFVSERFVVPF